MPITHEFVSAKADGGDTSVVRPSDWNAAHVGYGPDLIPTAVQVQGGGTNGTTHNQAISAAASGNRLVVVIGSNARDVNVPSCSNTVFTEVLATSFSTTMYLSIYVGVVSGGSSGTNIAITATGSNWILANVYEVADQLTPAAGASATLTNTSANAVQNVNIGPIAPARGTFFVIGAAEDNGTTPLQVRASTSIYPAHTGAVASAIGYAPGGPFVAFTLNGTGSSDYAAGIVAIT